MLLRFLPLVAAVAAWAPTGLPRGLAPAASLVSSRAAVLMKGRSQGDGPAKSTRRSIKTPALALQRAKVEAAKKRRAKAINAITPTLSAWTQGEAMQLHPRPHPGPNAACDFCCTCSAPHHLLPNPLLRR